jgi:hypothetical protein
MRLNINWRTFRLELEGGGSNVQAPASWTNGTAPSVSEGVRTFLMACQTAGLSREWSVLYDPRFNADEVDRYLGFSLAPYHAWERTPESSGQLSLGPLREAHLVLSLAV